MQEKVASLGKEQREAGGVDLSGIEGRIGKIGIEGQRASQTWGDTIEGIAAGGETNADILARDMPIAFDARNAVNLYVQTEPPVYVSNPSERSCLRNISKL